MPKSWLLLLGVLLIWGCANIKAPTGGPRDTTPPGLSFSNPANASVNFAQKSFSLSFDEWVKLNDIRNQLVVSPPLNSAPLVELKKRMVIVSWEEELKENTTYSFFFGDGIQDFTEGNSAKDLSYVFSTGPVLDSLQIKGKLVDALTNEALQDIRVLAYAREGDSLAIKELPDYFTRANSKGEFVIPYMREGDYEILALKDDNKNYLLDEGEVLGFPAERVEATPSDSTSEGLTIKCSAQPAFTQYLEAYELDSSGHLIMVPSQIKPAFTFTDLDQPEREIIQLWNPALDSLHMWLMGTPINGNARVEIRDADVVMDTINIPFHERGGRSLPLEWGQKGKIDGKNPLRIRAGGLIESIDPNGIVLQRDTTTQNIDAEINPENPREILLHPNQNDGVIYDVVVLPNAVVSVEKWANRDTLQTTYVNFASEDFADLRITLTGFHSPEELLFQILDEKNQVAKTMRATNGEQLIANRLTPGAYKVRWLNDRNGNSRWDGCDYIGRKPSEEVGYFPETIQARSNWVLDVEWIVKKE